MFLGALDTGSSLSHSRRVQCWHGWANQPPRSACALPELYSCFTCLGVSLSCLYRPGLGPALQSAQLISQGTLRRDRLLQRRVCSTLKPLHAWQIAFVVTGPHNLPWPSPPGRYILLFVSCTDAERLNLCFCWLANVSLGDCRRVCQIKERKKVSFKFRPPSGSEKFRRFQNNLLLAEILTLPTELALVRYKAINQALSPFERIEGFSFFFHPWISILWWNPGGFCTASLHNAIESQYIHKSKLQKNASEMFQVSRPEPAQGLFTA